MQPYAMMVPLYPLSTSATIGATAARYRSAWLASAPSTVSNANELHAISTLLRRRQDAVMVGLTRVARNLYRVLAMINCKRPCPRSPEAMHVPAEGKDRGR